MAIQIDNVEREAIEELIHHIKDTLKVKKLILFGSRARGQASEYSDIDLLVITEKSKKFADRDKLADISAEINVDYGVSISCLYYNDIEWETGENINPLLKENIAKEGIELVL